MPVMPDHWIRRQALESAMIEPFVETQKRDGVVSYGPVSYTHLDVYKRQPLAFPSGHGN